MTDLSPAAQAVLDAWTASENGVYLEGDPERLAATLRAAADQLTPYSVEDVPGAAFCRNKILAIANELEGNND